ncbi:MAG: septum formation inhibitor Maf [Proteobacteria bacterium]|uniref:dTTP/UTP pyrophosphatase n=1 Tax=Candidatus Avisuccinivibrio stercorigallinarum TaxID=2840704 RepID=A0A9D9DAL4_9GAMM|nr:septum formation inhibitor Maf [Candidatus Avisuccinivibrio stercorigallinarum]
MHDLILASGSPRRRDILKNMGLSFVVEPADIDESVLEGESPEAYVSRMARSKAEHCAKLHPDAVVLGADTVVVLGSTIFGKPKDRADAAAMIGALSGRTHVVLTAVAVCAKGELKQILERTEVTFARLDPELIETYVASGESDDKSGSYALQGIAAMLIEKVSGSVSSVVGLPACQTRELLAQVGLYPRTVKA